MSRPPVAALLGLTAGLLLPAAPAPAARGPANAVRVKVEAALGADGALRGTIVATWTGACAKDLRARLAAMPPEEQKRAMAALATPPLSGRLKLRSPIEGLDAPQADLRATWTLEAPRFAAPREAGGPLRLVLPLLAPYEPKKLPTALVPLAVVHDVAIRLPASMRVAELPPAFSSLTPDAGRYVLHCDVERAEGDLVLRVRRELEITGASPSRLDELMEGVVARDATVLTIVRAAQRPGS